MGGRRAWLGAAVAAALAIHPAGAAEVTALYQAYWAGLPAGQIRLTLRDEDEAYRDEIEIRTEGLPRLVTRFRGTAVSQGRIAAAPLPMPTLYDATYDLRKRRNKRLSMRFAASGGGLIAERGPADTSEKPPLAARFRTGVLDPLSAVSAIRLELRRGNRGSFRIPVYDGARRFDVIARVSPKQPGDSVLRVDLTLAPIAGFKGESSEDGDPDNAPRPVALEISNDQRLMPQAMRVSLYFVPLVIVLNRWCVAAASCAW